MGRRMAMLFCALFAAMTVTPVGFVVVAVRNMPDVVRNSPGLVSRPFDLNLTRDAREGRILAFAHVQTGRALRGVTVRGTMLTAQGTTPLVFHAIQPGLYAASLDEPHRELTGRVEVTAFLGASVVHAVLDGVE